MASGGGKNALVQQGRNFVMDWLLIRGLARESAHWGGWLKQLQHARPMDRFHTLDLPGTGGARNLCSPTSIAEAREYAEKQSLQLPRPLGLIGLSLGGMVALDWALENPEDCAGLVLISSSSGLSTPWRRMKPAQWPNVVRLMAQANIEARELAILSLTSNRPINVAVAEQWRAIQLKRPVRRANVLRQLYAASRYKPRAQNIKVPALVLASKGDRLTDWRCSLALAEALKCPLELHPAAGHDLPLDAPQWLIDQLATHFPQGLPGQNPTN
ncbi:alpha/beta fold hydrolase [Marinobacter litoralis]|uniref:alpha/beta fold hydrolase n=1 Tax=Marinobacter litoralis TaxID=187981 RepID=UPI0018EB1A53|nr:alpha/beta hydrolase [Marinobacter litoralis]MBJ6139046.1 alpha/beta hydrolase [Marinobacter litoralis]